MLRKQTKAAVLGIATGALVLLTVAAQGTENTPRIYVNGTRLDAEVI